jgi:hypothetical protein
MTVVASSVLFDLERKERKKISKELCEARILTARKCGASPDAGCFCRDHLLNDSRHQLVY